MPNIRIITSVNGRAQRGIGRAQVDIGRASALPGLYKTTPVFWITFLKLFWIRNPIKYLTHINIENSLLLILQNTLVRIYPSPRTCEKLDFLIFLTYLTCVQCQCSLTKYL